MLFFKSKSKSEELLPPPPPFPTMGFEEEEPKISAGTEDLLKEVESLKPKKEKAEIKKTEKKPRILKKEIKQPKITPIKKAPIRKITPIKQVKEKTIKNLKIIKKSTKPKVALPKLKKEKLEDIDFILPKELEKPEEIELPEELKREEIELPETLEDFDIEKEFKQTEAKPKEIQEAEEEIKSAIESIKEQEKPSFFKRLFARKKEKIEEFEEKPLEMPEVSGDKVFMIQDKINKTREALMRFDLETAKKNYIEVMKIYNRISPEEQAKFYHDVRDLYFERKSAEELKV